MAQAASTETSIETGEVSEKFPTPIPNHPLTGVAGSFADDPFWDEFLLAMENSRGEIDKPILMDLENK